MSSLFNAPISITNITRPDNLFVWDVTSNGTVITTQIIPQSNYLHNTPDEPSQAIPKTNENRRLYVGSMDYSIQEDMIREIFKSFGSIEKIEMPKEPSGQSRGYCFVEFHSPESVIDALSVMNNYNFVGRALKVRLPSNTQSDQSRNLELHARKPGVQLKWNAAVRRGIELNLYSPPTAGGNALQLQQQAGGMNDISANDRRIYVGSIDFQVTKEQVMDIFSAFGAIVKMNMVMNPDTNQHRGYGFIEYESLDSAEAAIAAMNGQLLLDRKMSVRKANPPNSSTTATTAVGGTIGGTLSGVGGGYDPHSSIGGQSAGVGGMVSDMNNTTMGDNTNIPLVPLSLLIDGIDEIPDPMSCYYPSLQPIPNPLLSNPTEIICIHGLLSPDQYRHENISVFREDLVMELSKFGTVVEVTPMLKNNNVKIYVRYSDTSGSQRASIALKNRSFDSKPISLVSFVSKIPPA